MAEKNNLVLRNVLNEIPQCGKQQLILFTFHTTASYITASTEYNIQ